MKKFLIFLTSLLALSSAFCFAGCNDKGNTDNANDNTEVNSSEDVKHGMPKVRFEFKDGNPACKDNEGHHKKHPHPPKPYRPAPPEDGSQDKNEN